MDNREVLTLLKNACANVVRGSAAALVAIFLPPFLTRAMAPESFGTWVLVLQLGAYVGYVDFGIQTAVGRFVAHANERGDAQDRDGIVSTSVAVLSVAAAFAIAATAVIGVFLSHFFRKMPTGLVGEARIALLLVAGSLALGLPASVFNGILFGLRRHEVPAAIIGGAKILIAVLLIITVQHGANLVQMGYVVASVNLLSYVTQYAICRRLAPDIRLAVCLVTRQSGRELLDYCFSLTIWQFAMLLVTGLDITLVGIFDFSAVAYYAVAASLVTFIAGLQNAIFSAMIPSTAVLHARGDAHELGRLMVTTTRYGMFLLFLTGLPLILAANAVLALWVGSSYAAGGALPLQILVAANIIRLSATPYVMVLIGMAQQRLITLTPLLEGFANLAVSLAAGYLFGAIGVAVGTLFGSLVGVCGNYFYNMRRTTELKFSMTEYFRDALLRPLACAAPFLLFAAVIRLRERPTLLTQAITMGAVVVITLFCFWRWGLLASERRKLRFRQA